MRILGYNSDETDWLALSFMINDDCSNWMMMCKTGYIEAGEGHSPVVQLCISGSNRGGGATENNGTGPQPLKSWHPQQTFSPNTHI